MSPLPIGGVTPFSTIDYPSYLSYVIYTQGCPWRCRYCHNPHFLGKPSLSPPPPSFSQVLHELESRVGFLDAVVFSGGEPSLHPSLLPSLQKVKSLGYKVGLHTSGFSPSLLSPLLPHLDWVGFDIKTLPSLYPSLTGVASSGDPSWTSLLLLLSSNISYEVRITLHSSFLPSPSLPFLLSSLLDVGVSNIYLQKCRKEVMLDPSLEPSSYLFPQDVTQYLSPIVHIRD